MRIGYTLMTEQSGPKDLVRYATYAEDAGFDFAVMSDHYFPWLEEQGHSGYAWTMLGASRQATDRIDLMTYVTCPIMRYHPAVVAQKAATVQILSDGRFTLGLGAGENLNEHVIGRGWPPVNVRHEMLEEAVAHHQRALRRRVRQPCGRALPGRLGEAVGPPRSPGADRDRRVRRPVGGDVRAGQRPPGRGRAEGRPGRGLAGSRTQGRPGGRADADLLGPRQGGRDDDRP